MLSAGAASETAKGSSKAEGRYSSGSSGSDGSDSDGGSSDSDGDSLGAYSGHSGDETPVVGENGEPVPVSSTANSALLARVLQGGKGGKRSPKPAPHAPAAAPSAEGGRSVGFAHRRAPVPNAIPRPGSGTRLAARSGASKGPASASAVGSGSTEGTADPVSRPQSATSAGSPDMLRQGASSGANAALPGVLTSPVAEGPGEGGARKPRRASAGISWAAHDDTGQLVARKDGGLSTHAHAQAHHEGAALHSAHPHPLHGHHATGSGSEGEGDASPVDGAKARGHGGSGQQAAQFEDVPYKGEGAGDAAFKKEAGKAGSVGSRGSGHSGVSGVSTQVSELLRRNVAGSGSLESSLVILKRTVALVFILTGLMNVASLAVTTTLFDNTMVNIYETIDFGEWPPRRRGRV